jgi:putative DNA methylase
MDKDPRYWHSRGYLPHFDADGFTQFVTFGLADSVPQEVLNRWREDLGNGEITDADFRRRVEYYLDQNYGSSHLRNSAIASCLEDTLLKWDLELYRLISWSIRPNHAHVCLTPNDGVKLSKVMHSIKSYVAHEANKILNRKGQFWAEEYFDRYIRDYKRFASVIAYIDNNPVKAKLCKSPEQWRWSSAYRLSPGARTPSSASVVLHDADKRGDQSS